MTDQIVTAPIIAVVNARMTEAGHLPLVRNLRDVEPDLYYAASEIAAQGLGSFEEASLEMQEACHHAVMKAALFTYESYRLAYYRLWLDTDIGRSYFRRKPFSNGSG